MAAVALKFNVDDPPERPELHASRQKLKDVLKPSYWQALCPWLHCGDAGFLGRLQTFQLPQERLADLRQQVDTAGVAQVSQQELPWAVEPGTLAAAVVALIRYGWPPSLLVVYDEAWAAIQQASGLMADATGGNMVNMDILAWYVDPSRGGAGFCPHRDRQPDDSPATFRPDGTAMYATLWLPLTDATPENSCLYVIPRFADPGYFEGDPEADDAPDALSAALPHKAAYQHIRALPCAAGSACVFTHRTIHWGSKGRPGYLTPRISMSWGCADDAYEPAYFSRDHLPCPPLALRLALAGAQMIVYHERFPAPPKQLALYYQAFTAQADQFDAGYRAKVTAEFLDASKEATAAAPAAAASRGVTAAAVAAPKPAQGKQAAGTAAAAEAAAEATAGALATAGKGKPKSSKAAAAAVAAAVNGAAAEVPEQEASRKRRKGSQQQAAAAEPQQPAGQSSEQAKRQSKRLSKRQKQEQQPQQQQKGKNAAAAVAAAAAAAATPEEEEEKSSEEEDEGDGIDWAQVAAAARESVRKAKKAAAKKKKKKRKAQGGNCTAASSSSSDKGSGGGLDGDSDEGNVMELALDAVLDAQLAGQDFHDDFEDD